MKVIDLLNKIANGEIKQGTKIKYMGMEFLYDFPNLCGIYKVGGNTAFKNSLFYFIDASRLDNNIEIIEDNTIDIDSIEELAYETVIETLGAPDYFKGNELYCLETLSKNDENLLHSNAKNHKKINQLIQAVKQLNKEIKELKER